MTGDLPPVFDPDVVADVATGESVEYDALSGGLTAVQRVVEGFGDLSVDDIVYEWRTQHHQDPLVNSTPDAYFLDVRAHVWDDILERAEVDDSIRPAIRKVHATQFDEDHDAASRDGAMVLART